MSTQNDEAPDLEAILKDPLSLPEGVDLEALAAGHAQEETLAGEEPAGEEPNEGESANAEMDAKQGEKDGDAPGTEANQDEGAGDEEPAGVASKDGKHIIPYQELKMSRERAARAEIMAQELAAKLEAVQHEIDTGRASKTRDVRDIVDDEVLGAIREEAPEVADVIDKLVKRNQELEERAQSAQTTSVDEERESRVQAVIGVEEAINAVPKLAHVRANDPETFSAIAELDTMLGKRSAWEGRPLAERFDAAVRMYEAANGSIELPGNGQLPVDTDVRVKAALAKAQQGTPGPSTLSDIPGGTPAAESNQDALTALSSTALTERFMTMSPEQIEAELARLA